MQITIHDKRTEAAQGGFGQTAEKARKRKIPPFLNDGIMLPALAAPANGGHLRSGKLPYLQACRLGLQTF